MVYANSGCMKCFECGDVGYNRMACPHEAQNSEETAVMLLMVKLKVPNVV